MIGAVRDGEADLAMLPVENTTYGRVADIHRLLPESGLHIVDEAFVRVHINLLGVPGTRLDQVKEAHSHLVLLPQCGTFLRENNITGRVSPDNARAAREVAPTCPEKCQTFMSILVNYFGIINPSFCDFLSNFF